MWERIKVIVIKEFRQLLREPRMRAVLVGPPILQLILFGYAVNLDVERTRIGWMDLDRTPASRELLARFQGSGYFEVRALPASEREVQELLDRDRVRAVIRVLPGFSRDLRFGRTAAVQVLLDGTNSNTAGIVSNYAVAIVGRYSRDVLAGHRRTLLVGATAAAGGPLGFSVPQIDVRSRVWFNPDLRSRVYFVPGVIANILMLVTVMLTAMAMVREREIGTMEQLMVTPIRPFELVIGKTLPFACVGLFNMLTITAAALLVFGVPFRGAPPVLLLSTVLFLLSSLGVGLFISTVSHTQQQAMMTTFFFFQPAMMFNGFAFPIRNMPEFFQWLSLLNPGRYFMEIVRGVFLKGAGLESLWPQMLALAVLGALILGLSALRFHKRLD